MSRVVMVSEAEEFARMARGTVRAWWGLEFIAEASALVTFTAEAPSGEGYVVYRARRLLTPYIIYNIARRIGVELDGAEFEEKVYACAQVLFDEFMEELRRRGLEVRKGRYFVGLKPVVS